MRWGLKDKNGKYRSRKAFKQDLKNDSEEPWEKARVKKNYRLQYKEMETRKKPMKKNNLSELAWKGFRGGKI